jgi:hypothetical protein
MPAQRLEMVWHESVETSLRYYVGTDAQRTAEAAWAAFEAVQWVFAGRLLTVWLTVPRQVRTVACVRAAVGL